MGLLGKWLKSIGVRKASAAIYARVSPDVDGDQVLKAQLKACRTFGKKQGWTDDEEYVEASGTMASATQPTLQRLLSDVQTGEPIHAVVVYQKSRLTRDLDRLAEIEKLFDDHTVQLVEFKEG
jgi:DNA invertase Pin-like site-specific DNA recombinase